MSKEVVTGELEGWYYDRMHQIYWGFIYNDLNNRFRDGTWIHTSTVAEESIDKKEGDIIKTRNSTYLLGKPLSGKR